MRHFRHAIEVLAIGGMRAAQSVPTTRVFRGKPLLVGDNTRMNVFGPIIVEIGDGDNSTKHLFSVNKFSELSTASDLINAVWQLAEGLGLGADNSNISAQRKQQTPQETQQQAQQQAPQEAPQETRRPAGGRANASSDLEPYNHKRKEEYEKVYLGETLSFPVWGIGHKLKAKKDGSGTYEIIEFYGSRSQAIYDFNVFVPSPDRRATAYDYLKIEPLVKQFVPNPGEVVHMRGQIVFKLNPSKTNDRVYWNIVDFIPDIGELEQATTTVIDPPSDRDLPF